MFVLQRLLLYGCLCAMCCVVVMIYFECVVMNLYVVVCLLQHLRLPETAIY